MSLSLQSRQGVNNMDDMKSEGGGNIKSEGARKDEFKLFVGGLSYKLDDNGLKEGPLLLSGSSTVTPAPGHVPVKS